jgi:hypothetical protein
MVTLRDVRRRRSRVSWHSRLLIGPLDWLPELHIEFYAQSAFLVGCIFAGNPMPERLCL